MKKITNHITQWSSRINWRLLIFLILVLNVKLVVKVAAIILFAVINWKMLRDKKMYRQRFTWFYAAMILIGGFNTLLLFTSVPPHYLVAAATGIAFWVLCLVAAFINYRFVEKTNTEKLHATLTAFFMLNAAITICQLLITMYGSGSINPFLFQGMHQKYFINTGDMMRGLTLDVCTTNALINGFGIVYFLKRNKMLPVLCCMFILLLTASNFTNLLMIGILSFLLLFQTTASQKSIAVVCLVMLTVFLARVSPQNNQYLREAFEKVNRLKKNTNPVIPDKTPIIEKPDSILSPDQQKEKIALLYFDSLLKDAKAKQSQHAIATTPAGAQSAITGPVKPSLPKADIHSQPYQRIRDTSSGQKELLDYAVKTIPAFATNIENVKSRRIPGKLLGLQQTVIYLKQHPLKLLTGSGIANFSSKLAFRATGLRVAGGYPAKFVYLHPDFLDNHLRLYLDYFSKDAELHSFTNSPNSVYDQLLAEYGLIGVGCFLLFYLGYFIQQKTRRGYGLPLLLVLLGAFIAEYWFEQLSIVILFELLMLTNKKESEQHA
jgi:hypothetical protein